MAVEIAEAYVSLIASARGIAASITSELARPLERAAKDSGAAIVDQLRRAVGGLKLTAPSIDVPAIDIGVPVIPDPAPLSLGTIPAPLIGQPEIPQPDLLTVRDLAPPDIGQPEIPEADTSRFLSGAKAAGVAAGAAAGAGIAVGFLSASGAEVSNDRLAAQLGINDPKFAGDLGKVAGRVYGDVFGESIGEVNAGIRATLQAGLLPEDATNAQIESVTKKVLGLADIFDQDLGATAATAGQLIRTGLAGNADEAFDVIVRGFQQGVDKSGDLLDTLNEYPTQFRQLGLSAADATGILSQGLKAGARDSDVVGDALKEFVILGLEGSKENKAAFAALGLSAEDMANRIAAGGPVAREGLDAVFDRLRAMPASAAKSAIAFDLFGSKSEDLQAALNGIDPSTAAAGLGDISGATDRMNALIDNSATTIEKWKRRVETSLAAAAQVFGPVLDIAPALGGLALTAQALAGPLQSAGGAIFSVGKAALTSTAHVVASTTSVVAHKVAMVAGAVATKAYTAAQWLLNAALTANPIGLIVAAVAALVAVMVLAYKHSDTFRNIVSGAFEAVAGAAGAAIDWLKGNWDVVLAVLTGPFGLAVLVVRRFGDDIVEFFSGLPERIAGGAGDVFGWLRTQATSAKDWVVGRVGDVVGFVTGLPGRLAAAAGDVFGFVRDQATSAKDWVSGRVSDIVGLFTGLPGRFAAAAGDVFGFLRDSFRAAVNWIIRKWNGLEFGIPPFDIPGPGPNFPGFQLKTPDIKEFHDGGIVPGRPGQDVLAILQAGERVIPAAQLPEGRGAGSPFSPTLNVSVLREEETPLEIVQRLSTMAYLAG